MKITAIVVYPVAVEMDIDDSSWEILSENEKRNVLFAHADVVMKESVPDPIIQSCSDITLEE